MVGPARDSTSPWDESGGGEEVRDVGKSCRRVGEGDPPGRKGLAWVGHKYLMDESDGKEGGGMQRPDHYHTPVMYLSSVGYHRVYQR